MNALLVPCLLGLQAAATPRGMTVEDLLSIESLGTIELSPDGKQAAVVILRSRRDAGFHGRTRLGGDDRGDVWLVSTSTGERRRLTDGAADGSGYWAPRWSPDGKRLAMLTSRGRNAARLLTWSAEREALEPAAELGVHVGAAVECAGTRSFGYVWMDETRLLAVLVPDGFRPFDFGGDYETQTVAPVSWKRMESGKEPSVSVLVSGEKTEPWAGSATVAIVDVALKRTETLADVGVALLSAPQVSLAPDRKHAAVFETGPVPPPAPGRQIRFSDRGPTRLGLVRIGAERTPPRWIEGLEGAGVDSVRWSPDGSALALLRDGAIDLLDRTSGATRRLDRSLRVRSVEWLDSRRLLAQASPPATEPPRWDWWVVDSGTAEPRNLTASMPEPPSDVTRCANGALLAVCGGELRRLDSATKISLPVAAPVRALAQTAIESKEVVVAAGESPATAWFRVSLDREPPTVEALPIPSPKAALDAHWVSQRALVATAKEESGVFAWILDLATKRTTRLVALNERLAGVAPAKRMLIDYRGADGEALRAVVLLPHDHEAEKRYPALTWVYAGDVRRSVNAERSLTDKFNDGSLNFLPLLAKGYVVLIPSIPLAPEGKASDPMLDLQKSVMGAVDRLIELGIADPDRIAVGGHSYGGYTTYALVTRTNRFKAAIAAAGQTDLFSTFGTFDARFRYEDAANEGISRMRWAEGGQGRMGGPPYADPALYFRNSPMSAVDRVETPILIIHGDIDFVPISQAEEFYSALYRLGKPARFLRYWGEGHTVESPANIRHMWNEIFAWLDKYLGAK